MQLQTEVRTVCPYCGVGCGVLASVRGGMVIGVRGDPDHPTNRGGLCAKGQRLAETVRTGDRMLHPMRRRVGPDGRFDRRGPWERSGWEETLADCAARLQRIQEEHGPDAVAFYLSGQLLTEDYYVANKLVKGFLGTNNVDTNSRLCMASAAAAYKLSLGSDGPPGCYEDADHATCVAFLGSNAADNHPIVFGRLLEARRRTGARWIVIDPRRTATAAEADLHLPITPGSDVPLLLAMLDVCVRERLVSLPFIRQHTQGYDSAIAVAAEWPPERAAAECGVPADDIREAARLFAGSEASLSLWCQGLNQSVAATHKNLALINLHLATGQIGRPGTGPFSLTGQANAMGGREVGGMATELAAHRKLANAADREEVRAFWGSGPIREERGITAVELVDALLERRVRALWIAGSNPIASLPDAGRAEQALQCAELLVVQDLYHPTDTSVHADVLLPAAGWAEKTGVATSSERRLVLAPAVVAPPGEARPDWEIFADLARHLGHRAAFSYDGAADVFDEHAALTRGRTCDIGGISHARLQETGSVQWPCPDRAHPGTARRYTDGTFATADGRAQLHPTPHLATAEAPSPEYPLRLTTYRSPYAWHTLTKSGKVAWLRRMDPGPIVQIHPNDARAAGIEDGAMLQMTSPRGRWRGVAAHTTDLPPGTVAVPFHRATLWDRGAWVNRLTIAALDARSLQPELKHTVVRVEPLGSSLHDILVVGGEPAGQLARALERGGVRGVETASWATTLPASRAWCLMLDGSPDSTRLLEREGLGDELVVDAAGRLTSRDGGYAVGAGVVTVNRLRTTTEPEELAAALLAEGLSGPRMLAPGEWRSLGMGAIRFSAGDIDTAEDDLPQGVQRRRVHDSTGRLTVTWRMAAGQVLGVEAIGPYAEVETVARAWLEDRSPEEIRSGVGTTVTPRTPDAFTEGAPETGPGDAGATRLRRFRRGRSGPARHSRLGSRP